MSVFSSGGASWTLDATMDDPGKNYPNPAVTPASTSFPVLAIYNSSMLYGSSLSGGSSGGVTSQIFVIWQPIAAWRLTVYGSSAGPVTATVLQAGAPN